jgi:cation-transporting ATPase 13A2
MPCETAFQRFLSVCLSLENCSALTYVFITGTTVSSEHLVPGDVVNIMEENLTLFPADMLLLSGDVIVNESMLTGESVPIAKIPVKDKDFARWNEGAPIDAETAKSFLYTGTKVIRVRGVLTPTSGEQALAVVVRTGKAHIALSFKFAALRASA